MPELLAAKVYIEDGAICLGPTDAQSSKTAAAHAILARSTSTLKCKSVSVVQSSFTKTATCATSSTTAKARGLRVNRNHHGAQ